jgi:recombination protein RecT
MSNAISQLVLSTKDNFVSRQADKSVNFEAEAGFAIQALSSDYAMGIAMKNKQSVIDAVTNVAAIGISLNPAKKQAYLVPRDGKICLDISYMGLIDLAVATGSIKWAQAAVVYEQDSFQLRGFDEPPLHQFSPFAKDRGAILGVYCVVKTADGEYLTHSMTIDEVYAIRDRASQSFKGGKSSPWKTDEVEMIKKTCIKQAYKYWPKVERLQQAIHYLNTDAGEGVQLAQPSRRPDAPQVKEIDHIERNRLIAELEEVAKQGTEAFKAHYLKMTVEQKQLVGIEERNRIKALADAVVVPIDAEFVSEMEPVNE